MPALAVGRHCQCLAGVSASCYMPFVCSCPMWLVHLLSTYPFLSPPFAAVFMAKNAVLSSFASGRPTSLVVDAGHERTVGERNCCCVFAAHFLLAALLTHSSKQLLRQLSREKPQPGYLSGKRTTWGHHNTVWLCIVTACCWLGHGIWGSPEMVLQPRDSNSRPQQQRGTRSGPYSQTAEGHMGEKLLLCRRAAAKMRTPLATRADQMSSFSMASFRLWIWFFSWLPSLVVTLHAITGRDTPQARPSAALEGTKT